MIDPLQLLRLLYIGFVKVPLRVLRWSDEAAVMSLGDNRIGEVREE